MFARRIYYKEKEKKNNMNSRINKEEKKPKKITHKKVKVKPVYVSQKL